MAQTLSEIERYNKNLENKITIVRAMIEFYEESILNTTDESKEKFEKSIVREKCHLKNYKSNHPEFFI